MGEDMKPETKEHYRIFAKEWKIISGKIRVRYHHRCQRCFTHSKPKYILTVHHLDLNPKNNNLSNLVLLCQKCHLSIQSKGRLSMTEFYEILDTQESQLEFIDSRPLPIELAKKAASLY